MSVETDFWRHRRVFVTGASGFLGQWLVRELNQRGASVVALVRDVSRMGRSPLVVETQGRVDSFSVQDVG